MNTLNPSATGFAGIIRRKSDFLPKEFVSAEFDNAFIPLVARCFKTMIVKAHSAGDRRWSDLICKLERHALFDLTVPNEVVLGPMEFHYKDAAGQPVTRVFERTEPLSYGFERVRLEIDRTRVSDDRYLEETSSILAYLFAWRLFDRPLKAHHVALVRIDAESLSDYLHLHHRGEVSPDSLSRFIIARTVDALLSDLPALAAFDRALQLIPRISR